MLSSILKAKIANWRSVIMKSSIKTDYKKCPTNNK